MVATKTECMKFLLDNLITVNPEDFAITDLWTIISELIEVLKSDRPKGLKDRIMYNMRSMIKGVIYADS